MTSTWERRQNTCFTKCTSFVSASGLTTDSDHEGWGVIPDRRAADRLMDSEWQLGLVLIRHISSRASSNVWKQSNTVNPEGWRLDWWGAKGNWLLSALLSCGRFVWSSKSRYREARFSHVTKLIRPVMKKPSSDKQEGCHTFEKDTCLTDDVNGGVG